MNSNANFNGQQLENMINNHLRAIGLTYVTNTEFDFKRKNTYTTQLQIGSLSILGKKIRVDFVISSIPQFKQGLIIESKWQQVPGSVDEKYPYLIENILIKYPVPTLLVLDGGGYTDNLLQYLKSKRNGKFLNVFSMFEFQKWGNTLKVNLERKNDL